MPVDGAGDLLQPCRTLVEVQCVRYILPKLIRHVEQLEKVVFELTPLPKHPLGPLAAHSFVCSVRTVSQTLWLKCLPYGRSSNLVSEMLSNQKPVFKLPVHPLFADGGFRAVYFACSIRTVPHRYQSTPWVLCSTAVTPAVIATLSL